MVTCVTTGGAACRLTREISAILEASHGQNRHSSHLSRHGLRRDAGFVGGTRRHETIVAHTKDGTTIAIVTATDFGWLESDLLFFWKTPDDYGAKLANGLIYKLTLSDASILMARRPPFANSACGQQSTLIVYKGAVEKARSTGETSTGPIKGLLQKAE